MLDDRGFGNRLDILDDQTPAGIASRNVGGAVGTPLEAVCYGLVGYGSLPKRTRMPRLGAGLLAPALGPRLEEGGHLARGYEGIGIPDQTAQLGDPLGQGQDRKDRSLRPEFDNGAGIRLQETGTDLVEDRITSELGIHVWHGATSACSIPFCNGTRRPFRTINDNRISQPFTAVG